MRKLFILSNIHIASNFQVNHLSDDLKTRDSISVEQSVASAFNLRCFSDVYLRVVDKKTVSLDSVEITFKEQYIGRSEMWKLKQYLANSCVYVNKKFQLCDARCQSKKRSDKNPLQICKTNFVKSFSL